MADGLSRKYVNLPLEEEDGHTWSVSEDWEVRTGLVHDVFAVTDAGREGPGVDKGEALRARFANERMFLEVVEALLGMDSGRKLKERRRARHRALGYFVEDGRLWRLADGKSIRARARVECVTKAEAKAMAWTVHRDGGHFQRDNVKAVLLDRIYSPGLDQSITLAITECGKCKAFGPTHLHSLLEPITRRHPFELLVSDTLTLPVGKGGYKKVGLFIDAYSQRVGGNKMRRAATGKSTCTALARLCDTFTNPETFMVDGGPEFDNAEVREFCKARGIKLHIVPAYSPWINGLVEGTNKILIGRLKRLCAPDLGEDEYDRMEVPENWPTHFDDAVRYLNERILPLLKFSPNELLLGLVVNTPRTPVEVAQKPVTDGEVLLHSAYVNQQRLDGYSQMVENAYRRKGAFDKKVEARAPREVVFEPGQLVQVYRSDLDYTYKAIRKLEPKWSAPRRVVSRGKNSYKIETLEGLAIGGRFSARRLRRFIPREGTCLEAAQCAVEQALKADDDVDDEQSEAEDSEMEAGRVGKGDDKERQTESEAGGGEEVSDGCDEDPGGDGKGRRVSDTGDDDAGTEEEEEARATSLSGRERGLVKETQPTTQEQAPVTEISFSGLGACITQEIGRDEGVATWGRGTCSRGREAEGGTA
ncbi:hypothetical protein CVT25_007819 [Psilocybe cyanescens]|uniref:Integrase catalytic domain-containing protein n=1 Tax=Psilocybe cyanescens TaxID=93625 RepID=A0A409XPB5_PSICY|nr:hypothetical protein CVT25_007819 [Psilocybe cyanescens]